MTVQKFLKMNPNKLLEMDFQESIRVLKLRLGKTKFERAFQIETVFPSPVKDEKNSNWIKKSNIIEINPRTIGTYWNIVKYALTFPEDAVNILSIYEAGCNGSIYSILNYDFNDEFLDDSLVRLGFDTPKKQVKLVVNILHALDKKVGFDVIPHVDKYAELVFLYPKYFEWVKLNADRTSQLFYPDVDYNEIYLEVEMLVKEFLRQNGDYRNSILDSEIINKFFDDIYDEKTRKQILFGEENYSRQDRRIQLINFIRNRGYETVSVTEHCPMRPVFFEKIVSDGNVDWAEFHLTHMQKGAIIFNSLTPFKWYKIDENGYIDKSNIEVDVWNYFANKVASIQKEFNFDFLRADMAHVQHSHSHKNLEKQVYNKVEFWAYLKDKIHLNSPSFATLAEAFFTYHYIDGIQDLINKKFDITLGYLNMKYTDIEYVLYLKKFATLDKSVQSCNCVMSCDSDQPKNIELYANQKHNELRVFTEYFLNLAGYKSAFFEVKDSNPVEKYGFIHNFINYQDNKYIIGTNDSLFEKVSKLRELYVDIKPNLNNLSMKFLNTSDALSCAWLYYDEQTSIPEYLFVFNLNPDKSDIIIDDISSIISNEKNSKYIFSLNEILTSLEDNSLNISISDLINLKDIEYSGYRAYRFEKKVNKEQLQKIKNDNKVLLVSTECVPYNKTGGLADANCDFTKALKKYYPNFDVRIMLPLNVISNNEVLIDLGINADFEFRGKFYNAKLYKVEKPYNNTVTYFLYCDLYSNLTTMTFKEYFIYSLAVVAILPYLSENKKEQFDVKKLHLTDWMTAFVPTLIKIKESENKYYERIRTLLVLHNTGDVYQGRVSAFYSILLLYSKEQLSSFLNLKDVQDELKYIFEKLKVTFEINSNFDILDFIFYNYFQIIKIYSTIFIKLDCYVVEYFENIAFDEECQFNALQNGVLDCTYWVTDSPTYYNEIITNMLFSLMIYDAVRYRKNFGVGILAGIDPDRYNPENENILKYPFSIETFESGKSQNKKYIQKLLSNKIKDESFIKDASSIYGSFDEKENSSVVMFASRPDYRQKGIDIFASICPNILDEYDDVQILFVIPNKNKVVDLSPIKNIIDNEKYKGRIVLIDEFVPIEKFFAGADIFVMPSRYEPCGFSQLIAMRFGAVPVVSNTGGLRDTVTSIEENIDNATGFKTHNSLFVSGTPEAELYSALSHAIYVKQNNLDLWNKIIKNALSYDSSWSLDKISSFVEIYNKIEFMPKRCMNPPLRQLDELYHFAYLKCLNALDYQNAIDLNEQAISKGLNYDYAYFNLAFLYMITKNLKKGFKYYEKRFEVDNFEHYLDYPTDILPMWNKSFEVKNKTIYVYFEGGFGDTIFYLRYIPLLVELGANVILKVQEEMYSVIKEVIVHPNVVVISETDEQEFDVDYQLPMMSLPYALDIDFDTIPKQIDLKLIKTNNNFTNIDSKKLNVGIVWQASLDTDIGYKKSLSLENLLCLKTNEIEVYSLQKLVVASDIECLRVNGIQNLGDKYKDFMDTMTAINDMDVVVTVDTAVAHISASMNKPTFIILNEPADWRWFTESEQCIWYPSVRLFRINEKNCLNDVLEQIKKALSSEKIKKAL